MLYLPMCFKGAGLSYATHSLDVRLCGGNPFRCYFEAMCVIGFIRTSLGNTVSGAGSHEGGNHVKAKNLALLSSEIGPTHPLEDPFFTVCAEVQRQMLMVSLKEVCGCAIVIALAILAALILSGCRRFIVLPAGKMVKLSHIWKVSKNKA